jgi:hypothetical protein
MPLIAVVGPSARNLGGYTDHNPRRLWVKAEITRRVEAYINEYLASHVPEGVTIATDLELGVGVWAAEFAVENNFRLFAVDERMHASWTGKQKEKFNNFLNAAVSVHWKQLVIDYVIHFTIKNEEGVEIPPTAPAFRTADLSGAGYLQIDLTNLPRPYRIAGLLEELRSRVPDSLLSMSATVARDLEQELKDPTFLPGPLRERTEKRCQEAQTLTEILTSMFVRK